jgi:mono/diheme cytochrome c family protein
MSLRQMRRWSRLVSVLLLLATASGLPHWAQDDGACLNTAADPYGSHDETQHALVAGDQEGQEHCALCHWTRQLRSPRPALSASIVVVAPPTSISRVDVRAHAAPALDNLPARAPPQTLL